MILRQLENLVDAEPGIFVLLKLVQQFVGHFHLKVMRDNQSQKWSVTYLLGIAVVHVSDDLVECRQSVRNKRLVEINQDVEVHTW